MKRARGRGLQVVRLGDAQYLSASNFIGPELPDIIFAGITALPDAVPQTLATSARIPLRDSWGVTG